MATPLIAEVPHQIPKETPSQIASRPLSDHPPHRAMGVCRAQPLAGRRILPLGSLFESGGSGLLVNRPSGAEGWLPIAGLMNLKYFFSTGQIPTIHPAAMFLFGAFLLMSLLLKKAFCSWLCPVGTFSEALRRPGPPQPATAQSADIPLRGLKYVLLGFFVAIIGAMSAEKLLGFMNTPYGLLADVKMLNFFRNMGLTAVIVIGALVILSVFIQNFWCRYLCPYGALLGLASLFSPSKSAVTQPPASTAPSAPMPVPPTCTVDKLVQIRSVECTACMACVSVCPAQDALQFALPPRQAAACAALVSPRALAGRSYHCPRLHLSGIRALGACYKPLADQRTARGLHASGAQGELRHAPRHLAPATRRLIKFHRDPATTSTSPQSSRRLRSSPASRLRSCSTWLRAPCASSSAAANCSFPRRAVHGSAHHRPRQGSHLLNLRERARSRYWQSTPMANRSPNYPSSRRTVSRLSHRHRRHGGRIHLPPRLPRLLP